MADLQSRVLHVIPSLAPRTGGPVSAIAKMVQTQIAMGMKVEVVASDDDGCGGHLSPSEAVAVDAPCHFIPKRANFYTYAPGFSDWLRRNLARFDLVHVHGLFSHMCIVAGREAKHAGVPYLVTPHGIANRYGLKHKPLRKRLSLFLFDRPFLKGANMVHMTSALEAEEFMDLGLNVKTRLIPIAVQEQQAGSKARLEQQRPELSGKDYALYVGRINPIKNIEALIDAFGLLKARGEHLELVIAGDGDHAYTESLKKRAAAAGVADRVHWLGFVTGNQKDDLYAGARCGALVSLSESFGMAAVEAVSAGVPMLLTHGVAVASDLATAGCAVEVPPDAAGIAEGLGRACALNIIGFAQRAKDHVALTYSSAIIGEAMTGLYQEALARG